MDPVTLIVTALAAGAASAGQDDARGAVKTALARLREQVRKGFKDPANGQYVLEKHAAAPEIWKPALTQELAESGAAGDSALLAAAQELMRLLDARGTAAGKYVVSLPGSEGVQFGGTQINHYFGGPHADRDA